MYLDNDRIPNCVPEFYREQQEKQERQHELAMQRRERYKANKRKLDEAARSGLPIFDLDGYVPCWECPNGDSDTKTDDEDDFDRVICHDLSCRWHKAIHAGEESR